MICLPGVARLSPTGPARVISMISHSLIEFEIHARNEDETNADDDLIIEGCTEIDNFFESKSFIDHRRFYGERCALDIKYIVMMNAVEALVEVTALRLDTIPCVFSFKFYLVLLSCVGSAKKKSTSHVISVLLRDFFFWFIICEDNLGHLVRRVDNLDLGSW